MSAPQPPMDEPESGPFSPEAVRNFLMGPDSMFLRWTTQQSIPALENAFEVEEWDYNSTGAGDLGRFIERIWCLNRDQQDHVPTRFLRFNHPEDSLRKSGVIEVLGLGPILPDGRFAVDDERTLVPKRNFPFGRKLFQAIQMLRALAYHYKYVDSIPANKVFSVYLCILSICKDVQMIEVPMEWTMHVNTYVWRPDYFPCIPNTVPRMSRGVRWRWGAQLSDILGKERGERIEHEWMFRVAADFHRYQQEQVRRIMM